MPKPKNVSEEKKYSEFIKGLIDALEEARQEYDFCFGRVNDLDYLTQDYLHKLELEDLDYKERAKVATKISKARKDRRQCKDRTEVLQPLVDYLTSDKGKSMMNLLKEVLGKTRKAEARHENRVYYNRRLDEENKEE